MVTPHFSKKLNNSGHEFDLIAYKGSKSDPSGIIIFEVKPLKSDDSIQLNPQSASTLIGAQMSIMWIEEKNLRYLRLPGPELKEI